MAQSRTMHSKPIRDSLSMGCKIGIVLDYLQNGGELMIDGNIWIWSDAHQGVAVKPRIARRRDETDEWIGRADIPLREFITLLDAVEEMDWFGMTAGIALRGLHA